MPQYDILEEARLSIQHELDTAKDNKDKDERNRLGQFATPTNLAMQILQYARTLIPPNDAINFLDPAFGTGSFYSALLRVFPHDQIRSALGYEIDPLYAEQARALWAGTLLDLRLEDFTRAIPPTASDQKANLLICNPPYVRHHHLSPEYKAHLKRQAMRAARTTLNGLTGLYCYFLTISHSWLAPDAIAGWLIPSEFMDVNYGRQVKDYLLSQVSLLRIHRFDPHDAQFDDAIVSSAVVWFKNAKPLPTHTVQFTFGGSLTHPQRATTIRTDLLSATHKWTSITTAKASAPSVPSIRLSNLFDIKRGLATGANEFFILPPQKVFDWQLPREFLVPILPSPRYLTSDRIEADPTGDPIVDRRLYLLTCSLTERQVREQHPALWHYLEHGRRLNLHQRYLCHNRSPWYLQENRPASPFLCTYMGRGSGPSATPFRVILNRSRATATNVYLMLYPKAPLQQILQRNTSALDQLWTLLSDIPIHMLTAEGRIYGGGLHKIEPKELGNVPADAIATWLEQSPDPLILHDRERMVQLTLF